MKALTFFLKGFQEGMTSSEVEELIERVMTTDLINILEVFSLSLCVLSF